MLFRTKEGEFIEIKRSDYKKDKDYYNEIMKIKF